MSKTNSGSNGRKKLEVVTSKTAEQLEQEAKQMRYDAQYVRMVRTQWNDKQILSTRDELRAHREDVPVRQKLQQEADLLLSMLNYHVMTNPNLRVADAEHAERLREGSKKAREMNPDDSDIAAVSVFDMAVIQAVLGGRACQIAASDDGHEWVIQISKKHEADEGSVGG